MCDVCVMCVGGWVGGVHQAGTKEDQNKHSQAQGNGRKDMSALQKSGMELLWHCCVTSQPSQPKSAIKRSCRSAVCWCPPLPLYLVGSKNLWECLWQYAAQLQVGVSDGQVAALLVAHRSRVRPARLRANNKQAIPVTGWWWCTCVKKERERECVCVCA